MSAFSAPTGYTCAECSRPVLVLADGTKHRTCQHEGTVLCTMSAVVSQGGGVAPRGAAPKASP